ncbi:MAG: hypothetical protein H6766_07350 [Candidatus Peribacteria bacterium]|nr:MAG: hypothetical protein H6766_07350 [Candidatus Peribacteria bacterium]
MHGEKSNTKEKEAKIMLELMNYPREDPAHWESAFSQAKKDIQQYFIISNSLLDVTQNHSIHPKP